jgi:hypothetical protein
LAPWCLIAAGRARSTSRIPLPDGGELRTLLDAARYVDALPRGMYEREEWQMVMEILLSAAEGREPVRLVHGLLESKR